jgi:hypothetical protein
MIFFVGFVETDNYSKAKLMRGVMDSRRKGGYIVRGEKEEQKKTRS